MDPEIPEAPVPSDVTHVHVPDPRRDAVARARATQEADPGVCTWCGENLPDDVVARAAEFCDRTCAKRHKWRAEDRATECRTCGADLPDSVMQRGGKVCSRSSGRRCDRQAGAS